MSASDRWCGFWPASRRFCELPEIPTGPDGLPTEDARAALRQVVLEFAGPDWQIAIAADYLCLMRLVTLEQDIEAEQTHNVEAPIYDLQTGRSRSALFAYCEALNALYFLIFCACYVGRSNSFLNDFSELGVWNINRYANLISGKDVMIQRFTRLSYQCLLRNGETRLRTRSQLRKIDHDIFADAVSFWKVVRWHGLTQLAALGARLISEHRQQNYGVTVALAWFEVERWLFKTAGVYGIPTTYYSKKRKRTFQSSVSQLVQEFPAGTWVKFEKSNLELLRQCRNSVAHRGYKPTHSESAHALELFINMFNVRSGLSLRVSTHPAPSYGLI